MFPSAETIIKPEDLDPHPVHYLLTRTPDDDVIQAFTETYLRPLQSQKRGNRVEIDQFRFDWISGEVMDKPRLPDPTPYLDSLLYQVMRTGDPFLPIPPDAVKGFANCGRGFYAQSVGMRSNERLLLDTACFPPALVVAAPDGGLRWTRRPESGMEQLYHFIFHLRMVMQYLAHKPLGKATNTSTADVAKMLTALPKRAAFVHTGDTVGVIYTHDTAPSLSGQALYERITGILAHTRQAYCRPRAEVERLFLPAAGSLQTEPPVSRWQEAE